MSAARRFSTLAILLVATGCANPQVQFVPSTKSAVELRSMQARVVVGDPNTVLRGVANTLQDLGYRITRAEPQAGTISATRLTGLRLAVVVTRRTDQTSLVRANATVLAELREAQVDAPEFYQQNFFAPLSATLGRDAILVTAEDMVPEALRPTVERLSAPKASDKPAPSRPVVAPVAPTS